MRRNRDGGDTGPYRVGDAPSHRDRGVTFVEILVSVVLLGTAVVGTLTGVRATLMATTIEGDHARARVWLQSAVGVVDDLPFQDCDPSDLVIGPDPPGSEIAAAYETAVVARTEPPDGFGGFVEVLVPEVWDGSAFVPFDVQTTCYDDALLRQQLLTLRVRGTDGETVEEVEVIKRGSS